MKRYLWTAVAVLFVNASASENPFALKENLLQINNEQDALLSELSALAEAREDAELEDDEMDAELEKEANAKEAPVRKDDSEELSNLTNAIDELVGDSSLDAEDAEMEAELVEEAKKHGTPLSETEKETDQIEQAPAVAYTAKMWEAEQEKPKKAELEKAAEEKADKEKAAQVKIQKEEDAREIERREVAAYEKERAEKLAKQAEVDAQEKAKKELEKPAEKVVDIDVEAEKRAAKETANKGFENAVEEMDTPEEMVTSKPAIEKTTIEEVKTEKTEMAEEKSVEKVALAEGDIDIEAEKRAAKEASDAAYLEAVREMDQEED